MLDMLFHVVNDRHKHKRSMVFTTNKALKAWGAVLHDEDLAHAIVDRILERGRILHLDGPSMRTRHLGLDDLTTEAVSTQTGRISGIGRAEFPEPTRFGFDDLRIVDALIAGGYAKRGVAGLVTVTARGYEYLRNGR